MSYPYKRDKNGKVIDHYTNTVEDAAKFEAYFNAEPEDGPSRADFEDYDKYESEFSPGDWCPSCNDSKLQLTEWEDGVWCEDCGFEEEFQTPEEEDDCKCSDPCCPCSGYKVGVP